MRATLETSVLRSNRSAIGEDRSSGLHWAAKRRSAVVLGITKGETSAREAAQSIDNDRRGHRARGAPTPGPAVKARGALLTPQGQESALLRGGRSTFDPPLLRP